MRELFLFAILFMVVSSLQAQNYERVSYQDKGIKAPNTHYIGEAWLNRLMTAEDGLSYNITKATFKANSTLDWHKHSSVQVLIIVEGEGYYQVKGKQPIRMKEGDIIKCQPGIEHWHASSKEKDVTYLALYGGSTPTEWTSVLSQEDYDKVADMLKN